MFQLIYRRQIVTTEGVDQDRRLLKPWPKSVFREGTVSPARPERRNISDAALGLNDSRGAGVAFELASEAKNAVDAAIEDILIHARGCSSTYG